MKNLVLSLLVLAFLLRLFYIHELHSSPFSQALTSGLDVSIYDTQAEAIQKGKAIGEDSVFYAMPLYPYLIGILYLLFGHSLYIIRLFQITVGTLNIFLIYIIGKKIVGKNGTSDWADRALLPLVLSCLYGVFIFYEGLLVPTTLLLFLDLIAILLLISDNLTKGKVFIVGLLVGLGSLCQGSNILFGLSMLVWFLTVFRSTLRKFVVHSALFYAAMFAVILPVTLRNLIVGRDLVPIAAHDGINFYIGNNPLATGTFNPPEGMSSDAEGLIRDSKRMAEEAMGMELKPSQVSRFWYSKGLEFIRKEPVKYLSLLCRKMLLFLNGKEVSDIEDFEFHRMFFPLTYKIAFLDFRIIGPLGLLGLGLSFRHRRLEFVPLWLFLISFMASSVLFFVNSRYRFPVVPVFILFAGYALWWGRDAVREKRFKELFLSIFILMSLSVLMNLRLFTQNFATSYYGLAVYYVDKGEHDKALKEYEKVLRLEPQMPGVHNNIGNIYYEKGDRDRAVREYKEEIRLFPRHARRAYYNLGTLYAELGEDKEAEKYLREAIKIDPDYKEAKEAIHRLVSKNIILATTTSTQDSGLLDVLIPLFEKKSGYQVKTIAVGTGEALALGKRGEVDVLLVHSPKDEVEFMDAGFGINRRAVMHNDFVFVGPKDDPAKIKGEDISSALRRIVDSNSTFVSRGDNSGTDKKEKGIWKMAGTKPLTSGYIETGQGMGETLRIADQKLAYTLTDRGTYLALKETLDLVIMVEGDKGLFNPYSVVEVNPAKFPKVHSSGVRAFSDFITSGEVQEIIRDFGKEKFGQSLFFPDAK